jgi:hypothetical protein
VPTDERLGVDDCKNLKDRGEPAIQLDKKPAIAVCESNTATQLAPQNNQLMSKRRVSASSRLSVPKTSNPAIVVVKSA